jgi:tetratricopeptide (TPR) repeat protein
MTSSKQSDTRNVPSNSLQGVILICQPGSTISGTHFEVASFAPETWKTFPTQSRILNANMSAVLNLNNLGILLRSRFDRTGDLENISSAIKHLERAVQLHPKAPADMPAVLNHLAASFRDRFELTGDLGDISQAIKNQLRAVELILDGDPYMQAWLNYLWNSFRTRFIHTGDISDAIKTQQRAVELTDAKQLPFKSTILVHHLSRFERTRDMGDLSEALKLQQRAIPLTPPDGPGSTISETHWRVATSVQETWMTSPRSSNIGNKLSV